IGPVTVVETQLLAGLAHRALGDQRAAHQAAERALALAEPDRLVLPFAMTGGGAARGAAAAPDSARRPARRHPRPRARRLLAGQRPAPIAASGGAQPKRAQGAALSPDQPIT